MNCEQAREILAASALGMADDAETRALHRHLAAGCVSCAGRLAELEVVSAQLAEVLPVESLPPTALSRLIAGVSEPPVVPAGLRSRDSDELRRRRGIRFAALGGLACLLLMAVGAAALQGLAYRYRALESEDRIARMQKEHSRFRAALETVQTRDARWIDLASADADAESPWGRILWDEHRNRWFLFANGLARTAEGKAYRLWAVAPDGTKRALGDFDADAHSRATLEVEAPPEEIGWAHAVVTEESLEASSGSAAPILLVGSLR